MGELGELKEGESDQKRLARFFRECRIASKMTISEAARQIRVSAASLDSYERGRRVPRVEQLNAILVTYVLDEPVQLYLLELLATLRPRSYRWVTALVQTGDGKLIRNTLQAYAKLGEEVSTFTSREDVPVPPKVFPKPFWARASRRRVRGVRREGRSS